MKFGKYLIEFEKKKEYKPSKSEIKKGQKEMVKKWKVTASLMTYIGVQDERDTLGRVYLWYRIDDPKHKKFRNTDTYQVK